MSLVNLTVHGRTTTGKNANRRTRAAGRVPAVLYGKGRESVNIELEAHAFGVALTKLAGRSAIFVLEQKGVGDEHIALLREIQKHPVSDRILHVDLMEIPRGVPVTVAVPVHVVGSNAAVKSGEGSVALSHANIELSCLPRELPEFIEIDISNLNLGDKVFVRDVTPPVGEIVDDADLLVLNIKAASAFAEEAPAEGEGEAAAAPSED
ncbi:MAG TPA: 50S ribosomal protein L25 [Candidatus Krumholzibacteria bacterium]|nr:50S ribosomal protein L25 [Candidatus Krumholzibacteria bacterium]